MRINQNLRAYAAVVLCCLVVVSDRHSFAQQAQVPPDTSYKIEANVNRVLVPVVVRDKQGRAVGDLKREDFQVFDNEQPRAVSAFTVEKRGVAEGTTASGTQSPAAANAGLQRFIVFLFDDMHLDAEDMVHAQDAGVKALDSLADSDIAVVVSISGKTNSGLTRDRARLKDAIISVKSRSLYKSDSAECPRIDYYQADLIEDKHDSQAMDDAVRQVFTCDPGLDAQRDQDMAQRLAESSARRVLNVGNQDVLSSFLNIREIVRRMAALPGQRELILVSPGFLSIAPETLTEESRLIDFAAQSNVTISGLDARGLFTTELDASTASPSLRSGGSVQLQSDYRRSGMVSAEAVMESLADGTGGTFFHNSNDLGAGFKSLTEVPEYVYVLELSLDNVKPDGSYHRLKVKVDRDGEQVEARRGYFVPKPEKKKK